MQTNLVKHGAEASCCNIFERNKGLAELPTGGRSNNDFSASWKMLSIIYSRKEFMKYSFSRNIFIMLFTFYACYLMFYALCDYVTIKSFAREDSSVQLLIIHMYFYCHAEHHLDYAFLRRTRQ